MDELGLLRRPILAAHSISIPAADWPALAAHPFTAVTCPSASMRAGADAAPVVGMRSAGVNIALGTDNVCNNNDYDLFHEMRTLARLASFREKRPGALSVREVLHIATAGGAQALGWGDQIGQLSVGYKADLIMLDQSGPGWVPQPANDPYTALVYSISGLQVSDVLVDGKWLLRDFRWQTLDYHAAVQQTNRHVSRLLDLNAAR
jgi:5-methylthioadenosine/S-adenosylhomocysteine deaminase